MSVAAASTAAEGTRESRGKPLVPAPVIRHLGRAHYESTWRAMQKFTAERDCDSADEIWFLEHAPIFTLGMNASRAHLVSPGDIPVLQIDRGGEVTYHGPGQLVVYPLIDLKRAALGVRDLVSALEASVVNYVAELGIKAQSRRDAPGCTSGSANLRASAFESAAVRAITAWLSTLTWILRPSRASIRAALQGCK